MLYKALEMIQCMSEKQLLFTFSLLKCYYSLYEAEWLQMCARNPLFYFFLLIHVSDWISPLPVV